MAVRRTTIELDEDLVRAAQRVTGDTMRATVERGLREVVEAAERQADQRRQRVKTHLEAARSAIDTDVLLSDQAWR